MMHPPALQMIQKESERWKDCHDLPQMNLLRLCLLREIIHNLHSEKSRCLSVGMKQQAQEIRDLESKIDELREAQSLQGDLDNLVQDSAFGKNKKNRLIPESLYLHLDRDKLQRYDRKWEKTIAAEAISLHWKFWCLDSWVQISYIEEWNKYLTTRLWPHGLVLFTESALSLKNDILHPTNTVPLWRGHWIIILDSQLKHPSELSLNLNQWPGTPEKPPTPAQWKLIYP